MKEINKRIRAGAAALVILLPAGLSMLRGDTASLEMFQPLPGERLFFKGDSITKGYAFGNYVDPSPLRTLYGMANILLRDNLAHPSQAQMLSQIAKGFHADGSPETVDTLAGEIQINIRSGELRTGDWMIYEDAGGLDNFVHPTPWPDTKDIYRRYRQSLQDMVFEADGTVDREHIRFMTMFDYSPKSAWCEWDKPLDDGVHSGNDAIRDEAANLGVRVIDMKRIMDRAEDTIVSLGWGRVVGPDGIHPNVYGNYVMTLAILESLGADISNWKIDGLFSHFRHPETGGDVKTIWGFSKDPTDAERISILKKLRGIVVRETTPAAGRPAGNAAPATVSAGRDCPTSQSFLRLLHYGRILDHPVIQPENTTRPVSYELGTIFQLDRNTALLTASLREQGGHDFEVGSDGFIFRHLSDIVPSAAIPLNRADPRYVTRAGKKSVLAKYDFSGAIVPLEAKLADGRPHPAAGTGFLVCTVLSFRPDRSEILEEPDQFMEFYQVRWDGRKLTLRKDTLPEPYASRLYEDGFNCVAQGAGFLFPFASGDGLEVVRMEYRGGRWQPVASGGIFSTLHVPARLALLKSAPGAPTKAPKFAHIGGEMEPSIVRVPNGYYVYSRGPDSRGRIYRSGDGLHYYFKFDHWNHTVPQVLNQGLDGSVYLTTNTGPRWLRNPLLIFALHGLNFVDPVIVHDEKQIGDDRGPEVPFCDHGIGSTVFLEGRWRSLLCYRVMDLRETNGEGAPPRPQTGLYLAELEYGSATCVPFRF